MGHVLDLKFGPYARTDGAGHMHYTSSANIYSMHMGHYEGDPIVEVYIEMEDDYDGEKRGSWLVLNDADMDRFIAALQIAREKSRALTHGGGGFG